MKKVIIKCPDSGFKIVMPNAKKYGEGLKPYSEMKVLQGLSADDWFLVDADSIDKSDLESRKQLYWENDQDGNPVIKKDLNWEKRLMPDQLIKKKRLAKLEKELDDELAKEAPNAVVVAKKQRDCEKIKVKKAGPQNEDPFWLDESIKGLNEKVAKGESDKPDVRKKLQDKIKELRGK